MAITARTWFILVARARNSTARRSLPRIRILQKPQVFHAVQLSRQILPSSPRAVPFSRREQQFFPICRHLSVSQYALRGLTFRIPLEQREHKQLEHCRPKSGPCNG